jgi:Bacteriophage HK97-gp10, putative tail-component
VSGTASVYQVLDRSQPKQAADGIVRGIAEQLRGAVSAESPRGRTGTYAGGWRVERIKAGIYRVFNETPYGKYIEYGTRYVPARPAFGRSISNIRARVSR